MIPRPGDTLMRYVLWYVIACALSYPTIYYLLSSLQLHDFAANLNMKYLCAHSIQGILVGGLGAVGVYLYERQKCKRGAPSCDA